MLNLEDATLELEPLPPPDPSSNVDDHRSLILEGEGVSSDGSTTSIESMHHMDMDPTRRSSKLSKIRRCQSRPDRLGQRPGRKSVSVQTDPDVADHTASKEIETLAPHHDGDSKLAHRGSEAVFDIEQALPQGVQEELTQRTTERISAVVRLLHDCHTASESAENRLSYMRDQQVNMEMTIRHLTDRLATQSELLKSSTRGGDSKLARRSESAPSGDSKIRSSSVDPKMLYR